MFPEIVLRISIEMQRQGGCALLVGGSVRDMVLGLPPKDFDLEVYGIEPDRLEAILGSFQPDWMDIVGRAFGVLKARFGEIDVDISIPRRESKAGSGHKGFEVAGDPCMPIEEAARRRDFTMNAMAYDLLSGEFFDFFGGREDLARGILRITDRLRFPEDALRVLRAVQFAARFNLSVDSVTFQLCQQVARGREFAELSGSRIKEEWRKLLLESPRPSTGMELGRALGAWEVLHPEVSSLIGVQQDPIWHPEGDLWQHTLFTMDAASDIVRREGLLGEDALVVLLAALCHDMGKPATTAFFDGRWRSHGHEQAGVPFARAFLSRLGVGSRIESRVVPLVANHLFPANTGEMSDSAIGRLARRLAPATIQELAWVAEADCRGRGRSFETDLLCRAKELGIGSSQPQPILTGKHLIGLGWEPGRRFGQVLRAVFDAQIEGKVNTIEEALKMAQEM